METPTTLLEAIRYFSDPKRAHDYFVAVRWPNGVACPRMGCGSANVRSVERIVKSRSRKPRSKPHAQYLWFCNDCKRQFSAKVGTIFEDSPIGLDKWLPAIWLLSADRNGISSYELGRALKVKQPTAWFILHRIRLAMSDEAPEQLAGVVEADETFVGGKLKFSKEARRRARRGEPWDPNFNKTRVLGAVQRGGKARAWVVPNLKKNTMLPRLQDAIKPDATLYTDGSGILYQIGKEFARHDWVNHALEYVNGRVHTNNIEGFWSVLRRTIGGTYIHINPRHLDRYLAEQVYRFNERENDDGPRFAKATKGADGKRLTYKALTAKGQPG